jgi:hypothetical protein
MKPAVIDDLVITHDDPAGEVPLTFVAVNDKAAFKAFRLLFTFAVNDKAAFKATKLKAKTNRELFDALQDMVRRGEAAVMEVHQGKGAETNQSDPRIISRSEAKAAGLTRYFTGEPCSRGHIAARSVAKRDCIECNREYQRARKERDPERVRALARTWARANRAAATTAR